MSPATPPKAIIGLVLSAAQGTPDWALLRQKVSFVYLASAQAGQVDPSLEANIQGASQVGLPFGLLCLLQATSLEDWKPQNQQFIEQVKLYKDQLPPALDLQFDGGLTKNDMNTVGAKFVNQFEQGSGQSLILRTNAAYFNGRLPLTDWARHRMLWVYEPGASAPQVPKEWANRKPQWVLWSYSAGENSLGASLGLATPNAELVRYFGVKARFAQMFKAQVNEVALPA